MASTLAQSDDTTDAQVVDKAKFEIFRFDDAPGLLDSPDTMEADPLPEKIMPFLAKAVESGIREGSVIKHLVSMPGFSLFHVWFKRDFPLPLHSHDSDCLYYIVAGSIRLGTETLGPRDSFFVPRDVPYQYRPGPEGVELLEFKHATKGNLKHYSKTEAFWSKAVETIIANREAWIDAKMPPLNC